MCWSHLRRNSRWERRAENPRLKNEEMQDGKRSLTGAF
jgi:hypothetical protein